MTFREWYRSAEGRSWQTEQMALFVRCSPTTIRTLARINPRRPKPEVMLGIARMTGGLVRPDDWFPELASIDLAAACVLLGPPLFAEPTDPPFFEPAAPATKPPMVPKLRKRLRPA